MTIDMMTTKVFEAITVVVAADRILLVTLNRPDHLNVITSTMIVELNEVVTAVDSDPELRAVILTGAGRGFSAGLEVDSTARNDLATLHDRIHRSRKPWIAAVNGVAAEGGFALTLACDIRIAARSATFGALFQESGASNCDMGISYFLPRLVGASRAAELMLTARAFDSSEAADVGLVIDVVDDAAVVDRALSTATLIRDNHPFAGSHTKEGMWRIDRPGQGRPY